MHWVNWDRVALPKAKGGLGLSKLLLINISLLSKWGWRFKTESNALWKRVVEAFHFNRKNWDFIPSRKGSSGPWSNIVKVLSRTILSGTPLQRFFKGVIRDGKEISFWLDPWIGDVPLKDLCPSLFRLDRDKRCKVFHRLYRSSGVLVRNWDWSRQPSTGQEIVELARLYEKLDSVSFSGQSDCWSWTGSEDGIYSVGAVKNLFVAEKDVSNLYILDWCKWIPAKCNIFAWRAGLDRLPTAVAFRRRGIFLEETLCPFCSENEETVDHIFTACSFTSVIWQHLSAWCRVPFLYAFSFKDLMEFQHYSGLSGKGKEILHGLIIIGCWSLWRRRNDLKFNNKVARMEDVIAEVKSFGFLWAKNRAKLVSLSWSNWCKFVIM
ncbi:putative reverse transcriptase zinc-binding domain-containing protein [Helianthus annuus]|nr:putative reverse transcriptase zinc-binding domain-containing protein [Helianthus annuus]